MAEDDPITEAYFGFHRAVYAPGALDKKTKELIALAVAAALRCEPCVETHCQKAEVNGATPQEMKEAIYVGAALAAGSTLTHGKKCLDKAQAESKKV